MTTDTPTRSFRLKGFTSLLLTFCFFVMAFSGAILFFTPRGRVANWTDWSMLGLGKEEWGAVHINNSVLFLIVAVLHIFLNWAMLWGYFKKKATLAVNLKRELAAAMVIALVVLGGTMYALPPFSTISAWHHDIKDYWDASAARAPVPHAEEFTLDRFAQTIHVSVDDATQALEREGFRVQGPAQTVGELAEQKGVPPNLILASIQKHFPSAGSQPGRGAGMGRGRGMGPGGGSNGTGGGDDGQPLPETHSGCDEATEGCAGHDEVAGMGQGRGLGRGTGGGRGQGAGPGAGLGMGWGRRGSHSSSLETEQPAK